MMARTIQLAVAAAQRALDDGGVDKSKLVPERFGVEFGAGLIATELPEFADASRASANCQPGHIDLEKWGSQGLEVIQPLWMLKYLPNMLACHVSILHDARGPNNSVTEGDAASLWRWARPTASWRATRPTSSWWAAPRARSTR